MSPAESQKDLVLEAELLAADAIGDIIEHWGFRKGLGRVWTVLFLAAEPQPAANTSGQGRHKRGDGTHSGQRKDASAAPGSTPGAAPSTTP